MSLDLPIDWSTEAINARRDQFYAATQRAFVPYRTPLIFRRGSMQYLWDEKGNKLIDLLAMNVCISVGHSHPDVVAAATEQAAELVHSTTMFSHPVPAHYAEELAATMPAGHEWVVHFTNSGSEAIDLALMMARTFTGNSDIISLDGSYHGATAGAQSVTGVAGFRHPVTQLPAVTFVDSPTAYRGPHGEDTEAYLTGLDRTVATRTSGDLAGILIEPVQGYGGIVPIVPGYIKGAAERVREAGGLLIIDEVQAGMGRTGDTFWAFETHDVVPEIMVIAKGMGNGYPLGAVVAQKNVAEPMAEKFLFHTYGAGPVSCAAGRAVLEVMKRDRVPENAAKVGGTLLEGLQSLMDKHDCIGDIRGRGLMLALEFVTDRGTKEPATDLVADIFEETRNHGLVVSKSGPYRSVLRLVPPMCLSLDDLDAVVDGMDAAISYATA